jgi:hypothetical protein
VSGALMTPTVSGPAERAAHRAEIAAAVDEDG